MRRIVVTIPLSMRAAIAICLACFCVEVVQGESAGAEARARKSVVKLFSTSPALFAENQGQWADASLRYVHKGSGANVAMTDSGPVFRIFRRTKSSSSSSSSNLYGKTGQAPIFLRRNQGQTGCPNLAPNGQGAQSIPKIGCQSLFSNSPSSSSSSSPSSSSSSSSSSSNPSLLSARDDNLITRSCTFSTSFIGAREVKPIGLQRAETLFNYHLGDDPARWRSGVPSYEVVAYKGLYEGIDLHVWGRRSHLKYEFHVAPGADWRKIRVRYQGISGLSIDANGSLRVDLGEGCESLVDDAPYIYQDIRGRRTEVTGSFTLVDEATYTFQITGEYDPAHPLIIDPDLAWSTYLGGSDGEYGYGITVDASGVYLMGGTKSSGWASGGFDTTHNGSYDAFVAKLTPSGGHAWSTYLGGNSWDAGTGIAVDASGIYLAGYTESSGWTSGGFDTSYNGGWYDAFVAKLTPSGGHAWSTYLGGSDDDLAYRIASDASGVYVTGYTQSSGWTSGGFDTSYNGGEDVFVAKLTPSGGHAWSTYLGGSGDVDLGWGIDADASGVYVTGYTQSSGWTSGGFDTTFNGGAHGDAFVAKLTPSGGHVWSTYLGGRDYDRGYGIAVDASGVYVTGVTYSSGWTSGGFDTTLNGDRDAFVAKLTPSGGHAWSTYLGGSDGDRGDGIALGVSGVYVTGDTCSSGWTSGGFDTSYNGGDYDAFVAKLTPSGGHAWSTYLGGGSEDSGRGIAVDASGVYVTGITYSSGWTSGGFDTSFNGGKDAFVARINDLRGDAEGDCKVDTLDMLLIRSHLYENLSTGDNWRYDLNGDGQINILDMIVVRNHLNETCE